MTDKKIQPKKTAQADTKPVTETGEAVNPTVGQHASPEDGIGERIKAKRTELGLNVEELARLTREYDYRVTEGAGGISASMLRRYEYKEGGSNPGAREICLLCDALDVSADWLVRGIETRGETSKRKVADALFDAVSSVIQELENPLSDAKKEQNSEGWKNIERLEKLRRACLPGKPTA